MSEVRYLHDALPCDHCPNAAPLAARLATMDGRIERIEEALYGNGKGRKGLVDDVESLVEITKVGHSTVKAFMWIGGTVAALLAFAVQFKQSIWGLFH
jgi:hypothetical protein